MDNSRRQKKESRNGAQKGIRGSLVGLENVNVKREKEEEEKRPSDDIKGVRYSLREIR